MNLIFILALLCLSVPGAHREAVAGMGGPRLQHSATGSVILSEVVETTPACRKGFGLGAVHLIASAGEWVAGELPCYSLLPFAGSAQLYSVEDRGGLYGRAPPALV